MSVTFRCMNTRGGALTVLVIASTLLAFSVTGPATADDSKTGSSEKPTTVSTPSPSGDVQPTTDDARYGIPPQWVQRPYVHRAGKRFVLSGSVLMDPYRTSSKGSTSQDQVKARIRVAKAAVVATGKRRDVGLIPQSLLADTANIRISAQRGKLVSLNVTLSKSASRQLAQIPAAQRSAAISVVLEHRKDTMKLPPWGLIQVVPGTFVEKKYSAKQLRTKLRIARLNLRRAHDPNTAAGIPHSVRSTIGNEPWYNQIQVANGTPFTQQVSVNPNIQCMWTGSDPNANLGASVSDVSPMSVVSFSYPYNTADSDQPGLAGATDGLNAPGTQSMLMDDLGQAGVAAGQKALEEITNPETYSTGGAIAATAGVALTFAEEMIADAIAGTSSCNEVATYPELFGVTSTVTGFGYYGSGSPTSASYPTPVSWTQLSGNQSTWEQYSNVPGSGPLTSTWLTDNFTSMIGAQTNVSYYWNGGQAAPMVSNNAESGSTVGGSGSYQGGLFQFVGPNPGTPSTVSYWSNQGSNPKASSPIWSSTYEPCLFGNNTSNKHFGCVMNVGTVPIQLGMLTNPISNGGLWIDGGPPTVTLSGNATTGYQLQCKIPDTMEATFQVPFAANGNTVELQGTSLATAPLNSSKAVPSDGNYLIQYFATTEDGQFIYYKPSVQNPDANGVYNPYLAPNAMQQAVSMANPNIAEGTISAAALGQLATWGGPGTTPQSVDTSDVAYIGCSVTASVNLAGMDITSSSLPWGTHWPMPEGSDGGWPEDNPSANYNFSWMNPVTQLNMNFQSMPVGASVKVS